MNMTMTMIMMVTILQVSHPPSNRDTPGSKKLILRGPVLAVDVPYAAGGGGAVVDVGHRGTVACLFQR